MMVKEVAKIAGISVRTLHHYDDIGLLRPEKITAAGYRIYSDDDLSKLQQILFFRELAFPLKEIKQILSSLSYDQWEVMELHRNMLLAKRARMDQMIETLEKTMRSYKGEIEMNNEEKFVGFDFNNNGYEKEARERWGNQAVDEWNASKNTKSEDGQTELSESMNVIYRKLASLRHESPSSEASQAVIKEWFVFLNRIGNYSVESFKGLGQIYVEDERFTRNIDKFGEGLSIYMRDAMEVFVDSAVK
ncbi:MerR family transcriptional regulator [Paenibacillus pini]|uniref:Transcriptional regulator n=2 Tax=Paenibacillus TaxID=44249 RepID=W7YTB8_9BACL|nr:transcriptional regulator [Paenibacillus pini JCM 16418]